MKRFLKIFVILLVLSLLFCSKSAVFADDISPEEIKEQLEQNVSDQLDEIDLSGLDKFVFDLSNDEQSIFGQSSFSKKVENLINGQFDGNSNNVFGVILDVLFGEILDFLPILASILAICVISSIISGIKSERYKQISSLVSFVCFCTIVVLVLKVCIDLIGTTTKVLTNLKGQVEVVMPILLTFLVAMGGSVSAQVYQPVVLVFCTTILEIVNKILMPIFLCVFVFCILSNVTKTVKFEKFQGFFASLFKWVCGIVFTTFTAFLTLQGITASTYDKVAVKTAKYTISGAVPIVGSMISSGFDVVLTSSMLIKNAVGVGGIVLLLSTILVPVLKILVFSLMLKLVAAIVEPITDDGLSNFLNSLSKTISLLNVLILASAFVFFIVILLVMFTANSFV